MLSRRQVKQAMAIIAGILAFAAPLQPRAQRFNTYNPRDLALLPTYCKYTQYFRDQVPGGNNPAEIQKWMVRTKGAFNSMHHYCWGLMLQNEAKLFTRDPQRKRSNWAGSINEFDYVIEHSPPDFVLLPEIFTK